MTNEVTLFLLIIRKRSDFNQAGIFIFFSKGGLNVNQILDFLDFYPSQWPLDPEFRAVHRFGRAKTAQHQFALP